MKRAVIVMSVIFTFITSSFSSAQNIPSPCKQSVVDRAENTVCLPPAVNKIVITCYGGASHEVALLGGADKIVGQPPVDFFPQYLKIFPNMSGLPNAGSFNNVSLEEIMILKPDIVLASIFSTKGNQQIRELGFTVVTVGTGQSDITTLLKEFHTVGTILGAEEKADKLTGYWNAILSNIKERLRDAPESKKKKVFYCTSTLPVKTERSQGWGHWFIEASGGNNVAMNVTAEGNITPEQLLVWNPDTIIVSMNKIAQTEEHALDTSPMYKELQAVKNKAIHICPIGTFWWDRPSPESILGVLWLAKILYPEEMKDLDLEKETVSFFARFYSYTLTHDEYTSFFIPRR